MNSLYRKGYNKAIGFTIRYYEKWILPDIEKSGFSGPSLPSLRELKLREFRERKKLLNPYEKDILV